MSACTILDPPRWASRLVSADSTAAGSPVEGVELLKRVGERFSLVSAIVPGARGLGEAAFRSATAATYEAIFEEIGRLEASAPVRLWNVIPHILEPLGSARHRYMTFNAGRHDAFARRYGGPDTSVPTASGIGHHGTELVIHALTGRMPGEAVENPRQVPAYEYSTRYGDFPPWFARATLIDGGSNPWFLVGGTASVVGEDARHGDLDAQLEETAQNLEALLGAVSDDRPVPRALRVYYVGADEKDPLSRKVPARLGASAEIEYHEADLCRPELLVEIEAVYEVETLRSS